MLEFDYHQRCIRCNGKIACFGQIESDMIKLFYKNKGKVSIQKVISQIYGISIAEYKTLSPRLRHTYKDRVRALMYRCRDKLYEISRQDWFISKPNSRFYFFSEIDLIKDLLRKDANAYYLYTNPTEFDFTDRFSTMEKTSTEIEETIKNFVLPRFN